MKNTLNLVDPSDPFSCDYRVSKFPDGQQSVTIINASWQAESITIKSRLNTFQDLELIICANQALREWGIQNVKLYIPYCIGGRSDRKFEQGGINYIKQVIAPILNSQNFSTVEVLDPHSDVLEACIDNFTYHTNYNLVKMALTAIDNKDGAQQRIVLVSPDAGAYKKVFGVAQHFGIERIITATKVRDVKSGKILHTEIPVLDQHADLKYVIVDDICDGGRTFIELAKAIKESKPTAEIYLVVTHGIFSAGYAQLGEYFESIYCTNSVKDIGETECHALANTPTKVKQLNVF